MRILCFKPTRNVHESGYRYIEYGYMGSDEEDAEVVEIVGRYDLVRTPYDVPCPFSLDLTRSGWFRILPRKDLVLEWQYGGTIAISEPARSAPPLEPPKEGGNKE